MSDRGAIEAEAWKSARESEPNLEAGEGHVAGFIAGRTVTAEQVEAAAKTAYEYERAETANRWPAWADAPQEHEPMRKLIRAAFRAAGFYVKEATND